MKNKSKSMKPNSAKERILNGIFKENPTFIMIIGMCPALAITTSAVNGIGMGLTTTAILILSNALISMLRNIIPDKVRIPAYIGIIATFVTIVEFLLKAYIPSLSKSLGVYIPLIVVNCIILGRAEAFAGKNKVLPSIFDGVGMGLGFTIAITLIGFIRELIGAGKILGIRLLPDFVDAIGFFLTPPGAFFVLGCIIAIINLLTHKKKSGADSTPSGPIKTGCEACGAGCGMASDNRGTGDKPQELINKSKAADMAMEETR